MSDALAPVRIVDPTRQAPGPHRATRLEDLGADMVRTGEPPVWATGLAKRQPDGAVR